MGGKSISIKWVGMSGLNRLLLIATLLIGSIAITLVIPPVIEAIKYISSL